MKICIFAALPSEISLIAGKLGAVPCRTQGSLLTAFEAKMGATRVLLAALGAGVASAAMGMGTVLASLRPKLAIMVGSAGSLPGSGLKKGDLCVSSTEILAELGVVREGGRIEDSLPTLPGLEKEIPLDPELTESLLEAGGRMRRTVKGRALTVAGVSGDINTARWRATAFRAVSENMEGYALALAGLCFRIPVAEIRGISNEAGEREKGRWDLAAATEGAQLAVMNYLESLT